MELVTCIRIFFLIAISIFAIIKQRQLISDIKVCEWAWWASFTIPQCAPMLVKICSFLFIYLLFGSNSYELYIWKWITVDFLFQSQVFNEHDTVSGELLWLILQASSLLFILFIYFFSNGAVFGPLNIISECLRKYDIFFLVQTNILSVACLATNVVICCQDSNCVHIE